MIDQKSKVALMTYAFDGRQAKGTALYARKITEELLKNYGDQYDFYLVHFDHVEDPLYAQAKEIIIPDFLSLPYGTRFVRMMKFFWKYRNDKFDIIHWFQPRLYPFFWFAPARHIVLTAHAAGDKTAPSFFDLAKSIFNFTLTYFHKSIKACIAVSEYARQEIIEHYGFDKDKVFVTYNGGSENFSLMGKGIAQNILTRKYAIPGNFILSVSRFQKHKNIETLIKAYELLRREHGNVDTKLVLVGSQVKGYYAPIELRERSLYRDDIVIVPFVDQEDLNALYSGAQLFVFPSINEGFGLPLIEAMASGTPVVSSSAGSLPEVGGDSVIYFDPYNIRDCKDKIVSILLDPKLKEMYISKGLERARQFTWDRTAKQTTQIYDSVSS